MARIRITVVKRLSFDDIFADSDPGCSADMESVCGQFEDGQEFISDGGQMPEGFCPGAYADIFRFISGLRFGADYPWVKEKGKTLACCTDGFRPVIFRLERIED